MKELSVWLFIIALFSCGRNNNPAPNSWQDKEWKDYHPQNNEPDKPVVIISMHRSACFGKCPSYRIEIFSDRAVHYRGFGDVEKIGLYRSAISQQKLDDLKNLIGKLDFFNLSDEYPEPEMVVYDLPVTTTIVNLDNKNKKVINRNVNAPESLTLIELAIDHATEDLNWERATGQEER